MQLRPYQSRIADAVVKELREHVSTLVVAPTGCGKTIVVAELIKRWRPQRAIVLAHREELIWQARDKIERYTGLRCEIEMADLQADNRLDGDMQVLISTIQTQIAPRGDRRRMSRFKPTDFGLLIVDESHHSVAQSYQDVLNYYRQNPNLKIVGVTATPDRADEEALGQIYETVAADYEILDAIHEGWLVDVDQRFILAEVDYSRIRTTCGDLNSADLAAVMEAEKPMQKVAGSTIENIGSKRAIVFTASVRQAEMLADILSRPENGIKADWVCGETPKEKRRLLLSRFASGELQVICNCGVLTEGFDDPGVEVIVMARPTKSRSLYSQMLGRALRPLPGVVDSIETDEGRRAAIAASTKKAALVLDFVGNSGRHKLMTSADILGGKVSDEACERAIEKAKKLGKAVRMSEALDEAQAELQKEIEERRKAEAARKARLVATVKWHSRQVNPFDVLDLMPVKSRGWDSSKVLSEKQRALLLKQGISPAIPYTQGRQLIAELFRRWDGKLCSFKQAQVLKRYGYPTNCTRQEASRLLDALAKNHWRKPVEAPVPQKVEVPF